VLCRAKRLSALPSEQLVEFVTKLVNEPPIWASELVQHTLRNVTEHCQEAARTLLLPIVVRYAAQAPKLDALALALASPEIRADRDPVTILSEAAGLLPHVHGAVRDWLRSMPLDQLETLWSGHIQRICFAEDTAVKQKLLGLVLTVRGPCNVSDET
jgi:hypothetical protein